jgi:hypothetical protein
VLPDLQVFLDLDEALHEHKDGSARDVNLDGASWAGVDALAAELIGRYETAIAHGGEGTEIALPTNLLDVVEREHTIHVVFESAKQTPSQLQLFVCEDHGAPWIELTFFPEHVSSMDAKKLVTWVDELTRIAAAAGWYFRYENVSWEIGDVSSGSGVVAARVTGAVTG